MNDTPAILSELARVKAVFQQRAILAHMGVHPDTIPAGPIGTARYQPESNRLAPDQDLEKRDHGERA